MAGVKKDAAKPKDAADAGATGPGATGSGATGSGATGSGATGLGATGLGELAHSVAGAMASAFAGFTRYGFKLAELPAKLLPEEVRNALSGPAREVMQASARLPRALAEVLDETAARLGCEKEEEEAAVLERPGVLSFRDRDQGAAVLFLHGFYMNMENTWGELPRLIVGARELADWDVFSLGYNTNFWIDVAGLWSASPPLDRLALQLRTMADSEPLDRYQSLAIVAHSMGGLVLQRALLDTPELRARVSHVILYGTPSNGLLKAAALGFMKRQIRDMAAGGPFITDLRRRWSQEVGDRPPFQLLVVAGDRDELVPSTSSLDPFPERLRAVVPGNHMTIVNVKTNRHPSYDVLVKQLTNAAAPAGPLNSARVAIESRRFHQVIDELGPQRDELDAEAQVLLALALESVGREDEAIALLRGSKFTSTDQMGTLAGRLKRRWLLERRRADAEQARSLYAEALATAEKKGDAEQAYYLAINVAFMDLAFAKDRDLASAGARRALDHCKKASLSMWRAATEGEAHLVLGDEEEALESYRQALNYQPPPDPWQVVSMYQQASRVAELLGRTELVDRLRDLFRSGETVRQAEAGHRTTGGLVVIETSREARTGVESAAARQRQAL